MPGIWARKGIVPAEEEKMTEWDIVTYSELAALLHCSEQELRKTPLEELPRYNRGKTIIFIWRDVIDYLKRFRRVSRFPRKDSFAVTDKLISEISDKVLPSPHDGVSRHSKGGPQ